MFAAQALMLAAAADSVETADLLLKNGATIELQVSSAKPGQPSHKQ